MPKRDRPRSLCPVIRWLALGWPKRARTPALRGGFVGSALFLTDLLGGHEPMSESRAPRGPDSRQGWSSDGASWNSALRGGGFVGSHLFLAELLSEHEPLRGASDAGFVARGDIGAAARRDGGRSGGGRFRGNAVIAGSVSAAGSSQSRGRLPGRHHSESSSSRRQSHPCRAPD